MGWHVRKRARVDTETAQGSICPPDVRSRGPASRGDAKRTGCQGGLAVGHRYPVSESEQRPVDALAVRRRALRHRVSRRWRVGGAIGLIAVVGTTVGMSMARAGTNTIHYPGSQGWAPIYDGIPQSNPTRNHVIATLRNGTPITINCTAQGTSQGSWYHNQQTTLWDGLMVNGRQGYTSDAWVDTGTMGATTTTVCKGSGSGTSYPTSSGGLTLKAGVSACLPALDMSGWRTPLLCSWQTLQARGLIPMFNGAVPSSHSTGWSLPNGMCQDWVFAQANLPNPINYLLTMAANVPASRHLRRPVPGAAVVFQSGEYHIALVMSAPANANYFVITEMHNIYMPNAGVGLVDQRVVYYSMYEAQNAIFLANH